MAASDLIQDADDVRPHVEVNVTTLNPPSPPPRVNSPKPGRLGSSPAPPSDEHDGGNQQTGSKMSSLLKQNQLLKLLSKLLLKQNKWWVVVVFTHEEICKENMLRNEKLIAISNSND